MKALFTSAAAAAFVVMAVSPVLAAPAAAQDLKAIGIVDLPYIMAQSNAYKTAEQQRPTTYKAQYDQAKTRSNQIEAQLKPMVDKLQADSKAANPNRQQLQQQAATIQQIDQNGQREINQIMAPVILSQNYVEEQIQDKLSTAIDNAAKARGVSIILNRDNVVVYRAASYDMNQAVIDELNKVLPSAQLTPPPGWLPREMREQQAAQAQQGQVAATPAQQPAATVPAPTTQAGPPAQGR